MKTAHAVSLLVLAALLLASACVEIESPSQACRDIADTFASRAEECGEDYDDVYDQFVGSVASGDCNNIVSIRDRDAFYDDCIPAIDEMACEDIQSADLPASCRNQLGE